MAIATACPGAGCDCAVDFKNTLTVLTSNLRSSHLAALRDGDSAETVREQVMERGAAPSGGSSC